MSRVHWAYGISGLVVEYIVAIDVTRVRFPADAFHVVPRAAARLLSIVAANVGQGSALPLGTTVVNSECDGPPWI